MPDLAIMQEASRAPGAEFGNRSSENCHYAYCMVRQVERPKKRQPRIVGLIAGNVDALFAHAARREALADRASPKRLAEYIERQRWGETASWRNIYRARTGETMVGLDVVDLIARAFGLEAWQLLTVQFDPAAPPRIGPTPAEQRILDAIRFADGEGKQGPAPRVNPRDDAEHETHATPNNGGSTRQDREKGKGNRPIAGTGPGSARKKTPKAR